MQCITDYHYDDDDESYYCLLLLLVVVVLVFTANLRTTMIPAKNLLTQDFW